MMNTDIVEGGGSRPQWYSPGIDAARGWIRRWRESAYLDITMLGSTGVGKTTMLASMYERVRQVVASTDLTVVPTDHATSARLEDYLAVLRHLPEELVVKGTPGTQEVREYLFDVGRRSRRPLFKIRFTDYPGSYIGQPGDVSPAQNELVQRALTRADVVVVAIDAPALVEQNGDYNDLMNTPGRITDVVIRMLRENMDRLIILAPLKCEKYMSMPQGAELLMRRIHEEYKALLSYIQADAAGARIACVLTPVQTIGSVAFSHIEKHPESKDQPLEFVFLAKGAGATYNPKDTEQPLRYALRFVVGKYRATTGPAKTLYQRAMGTDAALIAAMQQFGEECKVGAGFSVLQNHRFLRTERRQ